MEEDEPRHKVTIVYKSGHVVHCTATYFRFARNRASGLNEIAYRNLSPTPLQLGEENIESIWVED
jgi:hypothetical protein